MTRHAEEFISRIGDFAERDQLVAHVLEHIRREFDFAAFFVVQESVIKGWSASGQGAEQIKEVRVPAGERSALWTTYQTQGHFLGPLTPDDQKFFAPIGRPPPRACLMISLRVGARVVAILYADNGARSILPQSIGDLMIITPAIQEQLQRLLKQPKTAEKTLVRQTDPTEPPPRVTAPPAPTTAAIPRFEELMQRDALDLDSAPGNVYAIDQRLSEEVPAEPRRSLQPIPVTVAEEEDGRDLARAIIAEPAEPQTSQAASERPQTRAPKLVVGEEVYEPASHFSQGVSMDGSVTKLVPSSPPPARSSLAAGAQVATAVETETPLEVLLDRLEGPNPEMRRKAAALLEPKGPAIAPALCKRFPGRVTIDPLAQSALVPPLAECGELLSVLAHFGIKAAAHVHDKLDSPVPQVRFFALHFFASVRWPKAIPRIMRRLHDEDSAIQVKAIDVLLEYRDAEEFQDVLRHLHERFRSASSGARLHAAQLLARFKDVSAIPLFISVFEERDTKLHYIAEDALAEITKQRFGPSVKRWQSWWEMNRVIPRIGWLIDGLDSKDEDCRRSSLVELRALAGEDMGFDPDAPRRKREDARRKWQEWWERRGFKVIVGDRAK